MPEFSPETLRDDPHTEPVQLPRPLTDARFDGVHVALMAHLSRLPAHESGTAGEYLFALTITPAIALAKEASLPDAVVLADGAIPAPLTLDDLLPWNLGDLSVAVAVQTGDETAPWRAVAAGDVTLVPLPAAPKGPTGEDTQTLARWLEQRMALAPQNASRLARETLARAGTSLFPYNFALRQAVCFRVTGLPAETDTFRVAALPRFARHGTATPVPTGFLPPIVGWDSGDESLHQVPVAAYEQCVEFPAAATPGQALIDLETQRIKLANADEIGGEAGNWVAQLESRAGGLFDLSQRILDALLADPASAATPVGRQTLWSWILASSHDLANAGFRLGSDGLNLPLAVVQQLLGGTQGELTAEVRALADELTRLLADRERNTFTTPAEWLEFLQGKTLAPVSEEEVRVAALFAGQLEADWPATLSAEESIARWGRFISDLRAPENLRVVILQHWKQALVAPVLEHPPENLLAALNSVLRETENPVALLARGVVAPFWPAIIHVQGGTGPASEVVAEATRTQLADVYAAQRNTAAGGFLPLPGVPLPAFTLLSAARAKGALFPGLSVDSDDSDKKPLPERTPHPLVFQVDQLAALEVVDQTRDGDREDLLREMAGVVVFLQDLARSGSRGLNFGLMRLPDLADPARPPKTLSTLQVAPSRLGYVNGGRMAHLAYNNASLIARSEGLRINQNAAGQVQGSDPAPAALAPYFELPPKGDPLRPKSRLPGLAYGRTYSVRGFVVLNAGILPRELADPDHPAILRPLTDTGLTDLGPASFQVVYRRRVGIGAPTIPKDQSAIFARRKDVAPLALELLAAQGLKPEEEPPLALLFPTGAGLPSVAEFVVNKPATDLENWDRWVAGFGFRGRSEADVLTLRTDVRAEVAAERDNRDPNNPVAPIELDDPALEDRLLLVCEPLFAHPPAAILPPRFIAVDMTNERRGAGVRVRIVHGGAPAVQPALGAVQVTLPAGSVWRLKFYSVIKDTALAQFDHIALPTEPIVGEAHLRAVSPLELLVELAVDHRALPPWEQVAAALQPQIEGRTVALDFQRPNPAFAFFSIVEADLQIWSWTGRPVARFPFEEFAPQGQPDGDRLQAWDVQGFGHRPDGAVRAQQIRLAWSAAAQALPGPARLQTENREADPRALYFRWSARAFNRYAALDRVPITGAGQPAIRWRRAFLPARLPQKMPKPSLKLVLPLGRRVENERGEMCLAALAVFNDPWYQAAGLAEELETQVLTVEFPARDGAQTFLAAGHDPIVSTQKLDKLEGHGVPPVIAAPPPAGHTFDGNASEPLIVGTSFNVLLPLHLTLKDSGDGASADTSDWFFARVRFRRRVDPAGTLGGEAAASDWTAPEWIQFAPDPADLLPPEWASATQAGESAVALHFTPTGASTFEGWQEPYARLNPGEFDANRFDYWFVLTRLAQELGGQPAEAYVGTFAPFPDGTLHLVDAAPDATAFAKPGAPFILRILEIRTRTRQTLRQHLEAHGNAWELFFGTVVHENPSTSTLPLNDAQAQITRVSPRIRVRNISK